MFWIINKKKYQKKIYIFFIGNVFNKIVTLIIYKKVLKKFSIQISAKKQFFWLNSIKKSKKIKEEVNKMQGNEAKFDTKFVHL